MDVLQDLEVPPVENLPSLRRVSQSRRCPVWRVAHPFVEGTAIRLIVWFPPERPGEVVIVLFGADKAPSCRVVMGSEPKILADILLT